MPAALAGLPCDFIPLRPFDTVGLVALRALFGGAAPAPLAPGVGETAAIPGLEATRPQATYLVWVDCRKTGNPDPFAACVAAGVGPSDGRDFAAPGFIRLNTACPTDRLERALDRLRRAF
jgi:hypothetical protein